MKPKYSNLKKNLFHIAFLKNVRERREELKLSQGTVADRIGMDRGNYSKIENGTSSPGLKTIYAVADVLEFEPLSSIFD